MSNAIAVDPFRCRMWHGHGRLGERINEETCRAEIDSFRARGQQLPVLARPLKNDPTHDYELVYGARRLFVARYLQVLLSVEVGELTDREAVIALDIENRQRKDLSPFERGRSYSLWLRNGIFPSQDALARSLNVSPSQVSRLISLVQLPPVILGAFASPVDICESWGLELLELWQDVHRRRGLVAACQAISRESVRRPPAVLFKFLVTGARDAGRARTMLRRDGRDQIVKDEDGVPLFRVRQRRSATALLLPAGVVSPALLAEIKHGITQVLQRAKVQADDFSLKRGLQQVSLPALHAALRPPEGGELLAAQNSAIG